MLFLLLLGNYVNIYSIYTLFNYSILLSLFSYILMLK